MKTAWLKLFSLIWLVCAALISAALLTPGLLVKPPATDNSGTAATGQNSTEMGWMRVVKQFDNVRSKFARTPDLSGLPAVQAIRQAAAKEKVALQVRPLPASGAGPLRRAELKLVARGSAPALTRVLQAAESQLQAGTLPVLGMDSWSFRSLGKQDQLDLTLWTLVIQSKR